jgi:alkylhydroperoxidase family enzyme
MARIQYATKETATGKSKEYLEKMEERGVPILNMFRTVLKSPTVGPAFLRLGVALLEKDDLSPILREIAILRVGHLTKAHYEWTQHVRIALECGVTQAQVDAIAGDWKNSGQFTEEALAVIQFTDEITQNVKASDAAFAAVRKFMSEQVVLELTVTIGFYNMVSRILETMEVELES